MNLAPYAANPSKSLGRRHTEEAARWRSEFQRDRDRIVHSTAFRRLVYKTQVFVNHEGDLFRTRLTHSLEVAQIARSVARNLQLNEDLVETISLAHDLGHTAFGHAGQDALNACMSEYGGFEHNLQSLRVVDELEEKYIAFPGLNLCFESREGILKHCSRRNAEQLGTLGQRFLNRTLPGAEAQLANLADEIAYNNHDVDDGLRAGLLTIEQLCEVPVFARHHTAIKKSHPNLDQRALRHEIVRRMINELVIDLTRESQSRLAFSNAGSIEDVRQADKPLIAYSDQAQAESRELKKFLMEHLYQNHRVRRSGRKAKQLLSELFQAFTEDPKLLPEKHRRAADCIGLHRAVADYLAGMTDRYAIDEHERLFDPRRL